MISLGGVRCFLFPEDLTTPEFRGTYQLERLRPTLQVWLLFSFLFALLSLLLCQTKVPSLGGMLTSAFTTLLGGAEVEVREFHQPGFLRQDFRDPLSGA